MADIKESVTDLIGRTPLMRLGRYAHGAPAQLLAKLEFNNPLRSVKDRAAFSMIETGEMMGQIVAGTTIIEATSGNTGIALAFICASRGYPLIITMPEDSSAEKRVMLETLGARVHLTPSSALMKGAIERALQLCETTENSFMPRQFDNPANPKAHFEATAPEIWKDSDGEVDIFVAGVGTGGTVSGVGNYLKTKKSTVRIIAVEPEGSAVLSGKKPGRHRIQGIGAGFVPANLDRSIIDEVICVSDNDAINACRELARTEGLLVGLSSGANLHASLLLASRPENRDKMIVTVMCDTGERYFSTDLFAPGTK